VTETHIHADFVSGAQALAVATGATLHLSAEGAMDWGYTGDAFERAQSLRDGSAISFGKVRVRAAHTPGHTPEHLTFFVSDLERGSEPVGALTGDFVFVGDVGRPDLLKRAAGAGRREIRVPATLPASLATPAEKQLARAFIESKDLADKFLATLIEEGDTAGLVTENLFKQILDARSLADEFNLARLEDSLNPDERRLVYEVLLSPGEPADHDQVLACTRALRRRKLEREAEKLQAAIQAAEREKDSIRLAELLRAKAKLAIELAQLRGV